MRALIQRVARAGVSVEGRAIGQIKHGLVTLLGISHDDTPAKAAALAEKLTQLRVFEDLEGKMNLSLKDVDGEMLIVSQFTLYGDTRKGRRPSFVDAARPEHAIPLYEQFIAAVRQRGVTVTTGEFGARMQVELVNDGPVTLMLEV